MPLTRANSAHPSPDKDVAAGSTLFKVGAQLRPLPDQKLLSFFIRFKAELKNRTFFPPLVGLQRERISIPYASDANCPKKAEAEGRRPYRPTRLVRMRIAPLKWNAKNSCLNHYNNLNFTIIHQNKNSPDVTDVCLDRTGLHAHWCCGLYPPKMGKRRAL